MKFNLGILHVFFDLEFVPALAMHGTHPSCELKVIFLLFFPWKSLQKGKGNLIQRLQLWGTALAARLSFRWVYIPTLLAEPKSSVHWKASRAWVLHSICNISTRRKREIGMKTTERLFG